MMNILALETSCDETSVAIVQSGRSVLANIIRSQADFHAKFGGVIPEMAARQHLEAVNYLIQEALEQAHLTLADMDAFAATLGPGLVGALLVGATTAKTLSLLMQKPFYGVNHLYAHVASNYLETDLKPPFLCLLVSGGHTQILAVTAYDTLTIHGETLDDAVGEAYDKVARALELGYPGGPIVDNLAQTGTLGRYHLPKARTQNPFDFSFSGLKTATLRLYETEKQCRGDITALKADIATAFQSAATDVLVEKTLAVAEQLDMTTIALAGGVAANTALRQKLADAIQSRFGWTFYCPLGVYCTDNAAMVAASAFFNPMTQDLGMEVFSR